MKNFLSFICLSLCILIVNGSRAQNWSEVPYVTMNHPQMGRLMDMQILQDNSTSPATISIYCTSSWNGLWKTTGISSTIGDNWTNLTPGYDLPNLGLTAFVVDNTNPQYMYIATYWPTSKGQVFRSSNGGANWTEISPPGTTLDGINVNCLLISFDDPTKIYAGTGDGVYTITNARGTPTWTKMASPLDHGHIENITYKTNPTALDNTLYVAGDEIYRNVNGGGWTHLSGTGSGLTISDLSTLKGYTVTQRRFYVQATANAVYTYAIADNYSGGYNWSMSHPKVLFRYNGSTWASKGSPSAGANAGQDYGVNYMDFAIDPDPSGNIVYVTGTQLHIFNDNLSTGKWSNDGCYDATSLACGPYKMHGDIGNVEFNPNDNTRLYTAHDGSMSWRTISTGAWNMGANNNLAVMQITGISSHPGGTNKILAGTVDCGTFLYNSAASPTWNDVYRVGDGGACLIYSDQVMYASMNLQLVKSTDGGASFNYSESIYPVNKLKRDPVDNTVFYIGSTELRKVVNTGTSTVISNLQTAFSASGSVADLAVAASNNQYIYVIKNNRLFKSSTGGGTTAGTWSEITVPQSGLRAVTIDPWDPNHIFVAYNGPAVSPAPVSAKVLESSDGGTNWNDYSTGLPAAFPTELHSEKGSNCGLYLVTQAGVYYRNRALSTWVSFKNGMPPVTDIFLDLNYAENKVIAGCPRGAWISPMYCPGNTALTLSGTAANNDFKETTTTINSTQTIPTGARVWYRAGSEIVLGPGFSADSGCTFYAFIHNCGTPGNTFRKAIASKEETPIAIINENPAPEKESEIITAVYPNPTPGDLTIESRKEIKEIRIFDQTGKEIISLPKVKALSHELNISSYPEGMYTVKLVVDGKTYSHKVLLFFQSEKYEESEHEHEYGY